MAAAEDVRRRLLGQSAPAEAMTKAAWVIKSTSEPVPGSADWRRFGKGHENKTATAVVQTLICIAAARPLGGRRTSGSARVAAAYPGALAPPIRRQCAPDPGRGLIA